MKTKAEIAAREVIEAMLKSPKPYEPYTLYRAMWEGFGDFGNMMLHMHGQKGWCNAAMVIEAPDHIYTFGIPDVLLRGIRATGGELMRQMVVSQFEVHDVQTAGLISVATSSNERESKESIMSVLETPQGNNVALIVVEGERGIIEERYDLAGAAERARSGMRFANFFQAKTNPLQNLLKRKPEMVH